MWNNNNKKKGLYPSTTKWPFVSTPRRDDKHLGQPKAQPPWNRCAKDLFQWKRRNESWWLLPRQDKDTGAGTELPWENITVPSMEQQPARSRRNSRKEMGMLQWNKCSEVQTKHNSCAKTQAEASGPVELRGREGQGLSGSGTEESAPTTLCSHCLTRGCRNFEPH